MQGLTIAGSFLQTGTLGMEIVDGWMDISHWSMKSRSGSQCVLKEYGRQV